MIDLIFAEDRLILRDKRAGLSNTLNVEDIESLVIEYRNGQAAVQITTSVSIEEIDLSTHLVSSAADIATWIENLPDQEAMSVTASGGVSEHPWFPLKRWLLSRALTR